MNLDLVESKLDLLAGVLLNLIPFALIVLLVWKRSAWRRNMAVWRWRVWNGGLVLGCAAAAAMLIALFGMPLIPNAAKYEWLVDAGNKVGRFAYLSTPFAVILLAFGKGRQRWMGILSATLCFVLVCAASY